MIGKQICLKNIAVQEFVKALNGENLSKINTQLSQRLDIQVFLIIREFLI